MRIAFTGYRPQRLRLPDDETSDEWNEIIGWISQQIIEIAMAERIQNKTIDLYCGMASGCDIAFGLAGSIFKDTLDCRLHCVLSYKDYNSSHKLYNLIKEHADEWLELSDKFYKGCDNVKSQYMIEHCDVLLAIWDGNKSDGVWSAICKARNAEKRIIYCPKEILKEIKG